MSPETCQDPAAQLLLRGLQGAKGPTQLRERVGPTQPLTRPRERPSSSSEPARVSCCPGKNTSRAGHAESTLAERGPGLTPFCLRSLQGDTPASAACHPAVRLPVALGSRHSNHSCPGTCHWARRGSPAGARGPSSNSPLLAGSCQGGPGPSSHACP